MSGIGQIFVQAYEQVLQKHEAKLIHIRDLSLEFSKALLAKCIEKNCLSSDRAESDLTAVLHFFREKITSEQFLTEPQEKDKCRNQTLDERRNFKGLLLENGLQFGCTEEMLERDKELDSYVTQQCIEISKFLEERSSETQINFNKLLQRSRSTEMGKRCSKMAADEVTNLTWMRKSTLNRMDTKLGENLSDDILSIIHKWIVQLDNIISAIENGFGSEPYVLLTRSLDFTNIEPSKQQRKRLQGHLSEAKKKFDFKKNVEYPIRFSEVFEKVRMLDTPPHYSREDWLVGSCTAIFKSFINHQVVELLKSRIKLLLFVEAKFNSRQPLERQLSLIRLDYFGMAKVGYSADAINFDALTTGNIQLAQSGQHITDQADQLKCYSIEKDLDDQGQLTVSFKLLYRWTKRHYKDSGKEGQLSKELDKVEEGQLQKELDKVEEVSYPVTLIARVPKEDRTASSAPPAEGPKIILRQGISYMLNHKFNPMSSWIDHVYFKRPDFVRLFQDALRGCGTTLTSKCMQLTDKGDIHLQGYQKLQKGSWYTCTYCPKLEKLSEHRITLAKDNDKGKERICQECIFSCLAQQEQRRFLLKDIMNRYVDEAFLRVDSQWSKEKVEGIFNKLRETLANTDEMDEKSVRYVIGVESNGQHKMYRAFVEDTGELMLSRVFMEYAEVLIQSSKTNFSILYVLSSELKVRSYWDFCGSEVSKKDADIGNSPYSLTLWERQRRGKKGSVWPKPSSNQFASKQLKQWKQGGGNDQYMCDWNRQAFHTLREKCWQHKVKDIIKARMDLMLVYFEVSDKECLVVDYYRKISDTLKMTSQMLLAQNELHEVIKRKWGDAYGQLEQAQNALKKEIIMNSDIAFKTVRWLILFPSVQKIDISNFDPSKRLELQGCYQNLQSLTMKRKWLNSEKRALDFEQFDMGRLKVKSLKRIKLCDYPALRKIIFPPEIKTITEIVITNCGFTDLNCFDGLNGTASPYCLTLEQNNSLDVIHPRTISNVRMLTVKTNNIKFDLARMLELPLEIRQLSVKIVPKKSQPNLHIGSLIILPDNPHIQQLMLSECCIRDIIWKGKDWSNLSTLTLAMNRLERLDMVSCKAPKLKKLDVQCNNISALYLPESLPVQYKVTLLLQSNCITDHNLASVFESRKIPDDIQLYDPKMVEGRITFENRCTSDETIFNELLALSVKRKQMSK